MSYSNEDKLEQNNEDELKQNNEDTTKAVYYAVNSEFANFDLIFKILRYNILNGSSLTNRDIEKIAEKIFKYRDSDFLFKGKDSDSEEEKIKNAIADYVKGDRYNKAEKKKESIFSDFKQFCKGKYIFSERQWRDLHGLIHQVIMSSLSVVQLFSYIEQTFPLWSGLKRILLQKRRNTSIRQWEYALKYCDITETKLNNIGYDAESFRSELEAVQNYKNIKNVSAKLLITAIVNKTFPKWRFENIVSQPSVRKGWFPDGMLRPPRQHSVEKNVLYKLGYAFSLSLDEFDKLTSSCEKSVYDAFSPYDALYRFGLNYGMNYDDITAVIEKCKDDPGNFSVPPANYNQSEMKRKVSDFFKENSFSYNLIEKYIAFLNGNGVYRKSAELLADVRAENAQKYLCEIYRKFNFDNIKEYYKRFNISPPDVADLLKEKYNNDTEDYYSDYIENYIYKITETEKCTNPNNILTMICDGLNFQQTDVASGAFTNARLNDIRKKSDSLKKARYQIRRSEIMRLAYLDTLIEYFNKNVSDDDIIRQFEETAGRMLLECRFLPLHITLKLDFLIYLALSEENRCKTNIFQTFIPRK